MSASSIINYFSTPEKITSTRFYQNAKKYTLLSYEVRSEKKYSTSWKLAFPAKFNYLADLVFHICMIPITLLKVFFGTIKALYSWGDDTSFLQENLSVLHFHANTTIADAIGIFFIKAGISLRENNNVRDFIALALLISAVSLAIFVFKKADHFKIIYDPTNNSFIPAINWKI